MSKYSKLQNITGSQQARAAIANSGLSTYPYGTYVSFLHSLPGIRGTWTNQTINTFGNGFAYMSYNNKTPTIAGWDEDLQLPYTHLTRASSQYLSNTGAAWSEERAGWDPNPGLSIGIWLRITSHYLSSYPGIFSCWGVTANDNRSWNLFTDITTGAPRFQIGDYLTGTTVTGDCAGTVQMPIGKWIYVCAKWKPSTHMIVKLYFDGELQDEFSDLTSINERLYYDTSMTGRIGAHWDSSGLSTTFDGDIGAAHFGVTHFSDEIENTIFQMGRKAYKV